ncbi:MAG: hypothetical protein ACR2GH_02490 [Pseudonocardia sp.]
MIAYSALLDVPTELPAAERVTRGTRVDTGPWSSARRELPKLDLPCPPFARYATTMAAG